MKYRSEIDGLRTLAVVPVIFFHAGFAWFSGGFVGVDVFFVISGYLIATLIIEALERGNFSLLNFYERRARRILPALFFVMLACIPFAWFLLLPGELLDFAQSLIAVSTFSSNILFWLESGYFARAAELKPLLHTWSLAVEEQYYILFPLFLMLTWRAGRRLVLALLAAVFLVSLGVAEWGSHASPDAAFFLLPTRGWELLVGVFAAFYLQKHTSSLSLPVNQVASLAGIVLILLAVFTFDEHTPFPGLYALAPTLGTALLILCAVEGTWAQRLLSLRGMVAIGLISYSAYLWHQPLLVFARLATAENPSFALILGMCLLAFVLAGASYRYVEKPFRNRAFLTTTQVFGLSGLLMAGFVVTGLAMIQADASQARYTSKGYVGDIGHDIFHDYVQSTNYPCQPPAIYAQAEVWAGFVRCQQSQETTPAVVLFGDSHAEHLFIGIAEELAPTSVAYYIRGGDPFLGENNFDYLLDYINAEPAIETVVYGGYWHRMARALGAVEFESKLRATVDTFRAAGKQVVLLADVPDFGFDPANCNYANAFRFSNCEISFSEFQQQKNSYITVLNAIAATADVEAVSIDELFCNSQVCSMISGDTILYRDSDHLNIPASQAAGTAIVRRSVFLSAQQGRPD